MTEPDHPAEEPRPLDRRAAIKKAGVGAGVVVGIVWTSPRIEGLSLRSDYARAATPVESDRTFFVTASRTADPWPYPVSSDPPPLRIGWGTGNADAGQVADDVAISNSFTVRRSSNCATAIDLTWDDVDSPGPADVTALDTLYSAGGPYASTRQTSFNFSHAVRARTVTVHFTC